MRRPDEVVCATANPHKVAELSRLLAGRVTVLPRPDHVGEIDETGATLVDNALLKATAIAAASGRVALADDTGLEVDALGGAPGVRSARYAGDGADDADNRGRLLEDLARAGVPDARRTARFRTVIALVDPDGAAVCFEGECRGTIARAERGSGGFGYDAVFVADDGDGRTFAEMAPDEKDALSHRRRAVDALVGWLDGSG